MSYTTRILPPEEWDRLVGTEAETIRHQLRPDAARVVVVENGGGGIIACHVLQPVLHAECLWVHPAHQKRGIVGGRLWRAVQQIAREAFGVSHVCTASVSLEVDRLLAHVGATVMEGRFYMVPVHGEEV